MKQRIPSLDGLRAISIALVLFGHLQGTPSFNVPPLLAKLIPSASLGVRVFFVISGFLITHLLFEERRAKGRIDLGNFYVRRALRLMPPFAVYIAYIVGAASLGWLNLMDGDLVHALTYTMNYHHPRVWELGHLWSLSVEEQFYLIWPGIVWFCSARRASWGAVVVVLGAPLIRVASWIWFEDSRSGIGETFETTADALAVGCILASTRNWLHARSWYQFISTDRVIIGVALAVYGADSLSDYPSFSLTVGNTLMNVGLALVLDWCVNSASGRVGRVLNAAPMVYVGHLSYSLYLWQQPFLNRHSAQLMCSFPTNLVLAGLCALGSYYLVEQPTRRWGSLWWGGRANRASSIQHLDTAQVVPVRHSERDSNHPAEPSSGGK